MNTDLTLTPVARATGGSAKTLITPTWLRANFHDRP
jgi:hypothetical protein